MTILYASMALILLGLLITALFVNKKLEVKVAAANQESERARQYYQRISTLDWPN
jgi:hypothetical protein